MRSVEPTVPIVARPRGDGYDEPFTDLAEISLTHYWDWTGFPVVALPSGVGRAQRAARGSVADPGSPAPTGTCSPQVQRSRTSWVQ